MKPYTPIADSHALVALLAAGRGSRFGPGKLDAACAGKPLGQWAVDTAIAAGCAPGIIMCAPQAPDFARTAAGNGWTLVTNPDAAQGIGSTLALAARMAMARNAPALIVMLADMPLVPSALIERLCRVPADIAAATVQSDGRPGVPARFPAHMFGALSALRGDQGAKALLSGTPHLLRLEANAPDLFDVDDLCGLSRAETFLRQ